MRDSYLELGLGGFGFWFWSKWTRLVTQFEVVECTRKNHWDPEESPTSRRPTPLQHKRKFEDGREGKTL
jgi:hypothetical protein